MNKPEKRIINPYWFGSAIYATRESDSKSVKLSRIVSVGSTYIETKNTLYEYSFTELSYAEAFYKTALESKFCKGNVLNDSGNCEEHF